MSTTTISPCICEDSIVDRAVSKLVSTIAASVGALVLAAIGMLIAWVKQQRQVLAENGDHHIELLDVNLKNLAAQVVANELRNSHLELKRTLSSSVGAQTPLLVDKEGSPEPLPADK